MARPKASRRDLAGRARRIRAGASFSLFALLATLLLLPLHGTQTSSPSSRQALAAPIAAAATPAPAATMGAPARGAPVHDATDCPQCRALAQARAAVAAAPPVARSWVLLTRAPRAEGIPPLPGRPDPGPARPRAPPASLSILAA